MTYRKDRKSKRGGGVAVFIKKITRPPTSQSTDDLSLSELIGHERRDHLTIGDVVFGRLSNRAPWWPGLLIDPKICGYDRNNNFWIFWLGDNRISDVEPINIRPLSEYFSHCFRVGGSQSYIGSVQKAVELYARQIGASFSEDPLDWALKRFKPKGHRDHLKHATKPVKYLTTKQLNDETYLSTIFPPFVIDRLKVIRNLQPRKRTTHSHNSSDADTTTSSSNIEVVENDSISDNSFTSRSSIGSSIFYQNTNAADYAPQKNELDLYCLACGESDKIYTEHPLVEGNLCSNCTDLYKEVCFVYDQDGKKEHCSICCEGGDLIICDNMNCPNVFCQNCIAAYDSLDALEKIMQTDPWYCYLCAMIETTLLKPRKECEARLLEMFKTVNIADDLDLSLVPTVKKQIRVLSLFDGLATAKVVLDQLSIDIDVYYSSEIDDEAALVSKVNHAKSSIVYLGDVRNINLDKLRSISPIDLVIGGSPCNDVSIANPKRKGLYGSYIAPSNLKSPCIRDILTPECGRVALVQKVRTVTTRTNSLKQGKSHSIHPVSMEGKPDTLWPTELETLFGLPRHYTDVGGLTPAKRQKLIGQGWTVP
uniref:DNA (cytosine-5-)-methyltransferase n=1 Tax=Romanomermis culicivorax TaxID=13658 RepID=A0A915JKC3_ROMCU